ncbi:MAG TPA: hypothetical protein VNJ70_20875 [Thermoanaerobaculia bacterium]|nr:hypothetical protein [Thermoanaerobaculia bacterium]
MPRIDDFGWVRRVMKEAIGDEKGFRIRASGTSPEGPELEMGLYHRKGIKRLSLCGPGWSLNERPDKEQYVSDWTAQAVKELKKE